MSDDEKVLKHWIARILCSNMAGRIIRTCYKTIEYRNSILIPVIRQINNHTLAALFFGLYEKSEQIMISKHLRQDLPVVELGASIGVMSSVISKHIEPHQTIAVEALPELKSAFNQIKTANDVQACTLITSAYSSSATEVSFFVHKDHLKGYILSDLGGGSGRKIPAISLNSILAEVNLKGTFSLVCDIEGAEIDLFLNEPRKLAHCAQIIIELHKTEYSGRSFTITEIVEIVRALNYEVMDQRGNVYVFERTNISL